MLRRREFVASLATGAAAPASPGERRQSAPVPGHRFPSSNQPVFELRYQPEDAPKSSA